MADNSKIEWCDASWNPIRARLKGSDNNAAGIARWGYHCERISPGCKNCYASTMNGRMLPAWGTGLDYTVPNRDKVEIFLDEKELLKPLRWKKPRRIFPCSMTDWCADFVTDEMRNRMLAVAALCPQHQFLFLTKRADRCADQFSDDNQASTWMHEDDLLQKVAGAATHGSPWPLPNVLIGFSAEDQQRYDERWDAMRMLAAGGWKVWLSAEPLLGPITMHYMDRLSWVVVGGESGHGARPMHAHWAESLLRQAKAAGIAFFFKQWGEFQDGSDPDWKRTFTLMNDGRYKRPGEPWDQETKNLWPEFQPRLIAKVGKAAAGRLLDDREWNEFPEVQP